MNNRLQQFLELENITPARLADTLGVQRSGLSHILSGRNKPGYEFLTKLLHKFPHINSEWLLLGKGKPYKEMMSENGGSSSLPSSGNSRFGNRENYMGNPGYPPQQPHQMYDSILSNSIQSNGIPYDIVSNNDIPYNIIPNKEIPLQTRLNTEVEMMGYVQYKNPILDKRYVLITEVNTRYTPVVVTYSLGSGVSVKCKIPKKIWEDLEVGNIIYIKGMEQRMGYKKVGEDDKGKPIFEKDPNKMEWVINQYDVINGSIDFIIEELEEGLNV